MTERINPKLAMLVRPIAGLKHDPENARLHPDRNIESIVASLERSGQQKPIVATADGTVIAGNGMLAAAVKAGWRRLAVVVFDGGSKNEARAYALADNRTAELAKWDHEGLSKLLIEMESQDFDIAGIGWDEKELEMLLKASWDPPEKKDDGLNGADLKRSITMTHDQFEVVTRAITKLRAREGDGEITDGRALELICADYIASE